MSFGFTANRIVRSTGRSNYEQAKIEVNQEWNLELFEEWLQNYQDREVIKFLEVRLASECQKYRNR